MSKKKQIPRIRIEAPPILKVPDKDLTREQRKDAARAKQWFLKKGRNNGELNGNVYRQRKVGKGR